MNYIIFNYIIMDDLEKQFNNLNVKDKRTIKTFISFITKKYPHKQL